jgi:hypothetical protein
VLKNKETPSSGEFVSRAQIFVKSLAAIPNPRPSMLQWPILIILTEKGQNPNLRRPFASLISMPDSEINDSVELTDEDAVLDDIFCLFPKPKREGRVVGGDNKHASIAINGSTAVFGATEADILGDDDDEGEGEGETTKSTPVKFAACTRRSSLISISPFWGIHTRIFVETL